MKRLFSRLFPPPPPPVDLPTWTEIKGVLFPAFDAALSGRGLDRQRTGMVWAAAEANADGIRRTFELHALKAATIRPVWGIALDFVPHVSGSAVKWHRTFASARSDLWLEADGRAEALSYLHGLARLQGQVPSVRDTALSRAEAFWARATCLGELPDLFDAVMAERAAAPGMPSAELLPQMRLAQAFVLARVGRRDAARSALDGVIARFEPVADALRARLEEAAA